MHGSCHHLCLSARSSGTALPTYGWIWLITGIILIAAGVLVLGPNDPAQRGNLPLGVNHRSGTRRDLGPVVMPYDPVWALLDIIVAILVTCRLSARCAEKTVAWRGRAAVVTRSRRSPGRGGPSSCWALRPRWALYPARPVRPPPPNISPARRSGHSALLAPRRCQT